GRRSVATARHTPLPGVALSHIARMADDADPPRKFYELKPREFDRVNPPVAAERMVQPVALPGSAPDPSVPIDVRDLIRQGAGQGKILRTSAQAASASSAANAENDVHAILQENLARANAAGLNEVAPPTRPYRRRKRDYLLLLFLGNAFIAGLYSLEMLFGFQVQCMAAQMPNEFWNLVRYALANPATYAMGLVGMVFFTLCLTWLMYGVLDNY
ncbi:MAG TPA: hypothetical protein VM029_00565, partial [Opitutaceae bacterium]|nr:hypothetical protein [Opitutaceae bacterium]